MIIVADAIEIELSPHRLALAGIDLGLTAYDVSYLLLAQKLNAPLLTGDGPLRQVAGEQGVAVLLP